MSQESIIKKLKEEKEKAIKEISQGRNLMNNYYIAGKYSYKLSQPEDAEKYLTLCQKEINKSENPGNIKYDVMYYLAKTYQSLKKFADAYKLFRELDNTTNLSSTTELHNKITFCLYKMRRYYNAMNEASLSMTYSEEEKKTTGKTEYICRYYKLFSLNKFEKYNDALYLAQNDLKEKLENGDQTVIDNMCWSYYGLSKLDECKKDEKDECKKDECKKHSNLDKCKNLVKQYVDKYPTLNYYLANIEYDAENYEEAWRLIGLATLTDKESSDEKYSYFKGLVQNALGNRKEANKWFFDSIKVNHKTLESYIEIAKNYVKDNELQKAMDLLNEGNKTIDEKEEKRYELYFHLVRAQYLYQLSHEDKDEAIKLIHKDEAIKLIEYVRNVLNNGYAEIEIQRSLFLNILLKYFELYNLSKGYTKNDIELIPDESHLIGHGGFGDVYKGKLKNEDVSIKVFKTKITDDVKFDKLFKSMLSLFHEINIMETLHHRNLLDMRTILFNEGGKEGRQLYLITPLCKGGNLTETLRGKNKKDMSIKARIKIALQIAEGLHYMHTGTPDTAYIHHDLKSNNVLLVEPFDENKENLIKICDFGATGKNYCYEGEFTPNWSSPELLMNMACSYKTDIWSYGATLYEIFTNKTPYEGVKPEEIHTQIFHEIKPDYKFLIPGTPDTIKTIMDSCFKSQRERTDTDEIIKLLKKCL